MFNLPKELECNAVFFCMFCSQKRSEKEKHETETYISDKLFKKLLFIYALREKNGTKPNHIFDINEMSDLCRAAIFILNTEGDVGNITRIIKILKTAKQKRQPVCWLPCKI